MSRYSHLLSRYKKRRNRTDTPQPLLPPGVKLSKEAEGSETKRQKNYVASFPHRSIVGALMYLAVHIKPDLSYKVNPLSKFNSRLTYGSYHALHTLGYLSNTVNLGFRIP